jgi:hypothetical protein
MPELTWANRLLLPVLAVWWLALAFGRACALTSAPGEPPSSHLLAEAAGPAVGEAGSSQDPLKGRLQLTLGSGGWFGPAFGRLGAGGPAPIELTSVPDLGGANVPRAGGRARGAGRQNKDPYYHLGYGLGHRRSQARFPRLGQAWPEQTKLLEHAVETGDGRRDHKRGALATSNNSDHSLALHLGTSSRLQASFAEQAEAWNAALGKMEAGRRTTAVEFKTQLGRSGGSDLQMALTSIQTAEGSAQGRRQTTQSLGAAMPLGRGAQLAASVKSSAGETGERTRELGFTFTSKVGGGSTAGQLTVGQTLTRAGNRAGAEWMRNWQWTGGVGSGAARTNLRASMQEQQGPGATGEMARTAVFHADRALGGRLKLAVDREQALCGTRQQPQRHVTSSLVLAAELTPRTQVTTRLQPRRRQVEVSTPLLGRLVAHGRYSRDEKTAGPGTGRHEVELGVQGQVSPQERLEATICRHTGWTQGKTERRTSLALMYALKVDDDHEVSVRGGLAWDAPGAVAPEYRISFGYSKPV